MTITDVLEQLEKIRRERVMAAHHDMMFQNHPDVEALDAVIGLTKFLAAKQSSDRVIVSELLERLNLPRTF